MLLVLAVPAFASADHDAGPRAPRLTDLMPRSALVVGGELGLMGDTPALSLPFAARVQLSPELVLEAEVPFGYASAPGEIVEPLMGNIGVGIVGSAPDRIGSRGRVRWGLEISGRAPTAPGMEHGPRARRLARLRSVSPFRSERWSPGSAAVRVSAAASFGWDDLGGQVQLGAIGALPTADGPATAHAHYGLMMGHRLHKALWGQVELLGVQIAPGAAEERPGHYLSAATALRVVSLRFSPVFYIAVPLLGDVEGDRPLVLGIEMASW